jgi:uncharacterized protein (DUF488 family)
MKLFTIGFTKKSAEKFFSLLSGAGVKRVIDVRLNNTSQLAGFAKRDDLRYFTKEICGIEYVEASQFAPTQDILAPYKLKKSVTWETYAAQYQHLIRERAVESSFDPAQLDAACLLCSEDQPHHCHRRLLAEYLQQHWRNVQIIHL